MSQTTCHLLCCRPRRQGECRAGREGGAFGRSQPQVRLLHTPPKSPLHWPYPGWGLSEPQCVGHDGHGSVFDAFDGLRAGSWQRRPDGLHPMPVARRPTTGLLPHSNKLVGESCRPPPGTPPPPPHLLPRPPDPRSPPGQPPPKTQMDLQTAHVVWETGTPVILASGGFRAVFSGGFSLPVSIMLHPCSSKAYSRHRRMQCRGEGGKRKLLRPVVNSFAGAMPPNSLLFGGAFQIPRLLSGK